ncbi:MAG: rhomboid family intramembrane serine protease [Bacteroidales bacterium]|nr:rhomboid family intramembrane serine protease [Bacteroidales bacterium]
MITLLLIVLIAITSIVAFKNNQVLTKGWFSPYDINKFGQYQRFITHIFLHASWEHLIFNLLTFYFFGMFVERHFNYLFGKYANVIYILEFFIIGIIATLPSYFKNKNNPYYRAVGASGAISGILFTSILIYPTNKIYIMFIPIGIPGYIFGILYLTFSYYMSKHGKDFVSHDVHFYGAIAGFIFPLFLKPTLFINFLNQIM